MKFTHQVFINYSKEIRLKICSSTEATTIRPDGPNLCSQKQFGKIPQFPLSIFTKMVGQKADEK